MNLSNTIRELFTENPMTLEATRTLRRMLRVGGESESPYASKILYRFMFYTLAVLYFWLVAAILKTNEDLGMFLLMGELVLLTLLVPLSLYGAIAIEREKQTYESLILTRLSPAQIVCGKLVWRVWLIAGIIALFVPLLVVSHIMAANHYDGRVMTWGQLAWTQVIIFAWSVLLGAFSLWVSARSKKGITALMAVVAATIGFLIVFPALFSMFGGDRMRVDIDYPFTRPVEYNNYTLGDPAVGMLIKQVAVAVVSGAIATLNPFVMVIKGGYDSPHTDLNFLTAYDFWLCHGIFYWGVAVYAALAALLVRGSVKTLRGLEMPVAEKTRRARLSLLPKGEV